MSNVYSFRLRPSERDKVRELLSINRIAIGWSRAERLLDEALSYDALKQVLNEDYPDLRVQGRLGRDANHLWRFIRKMEVGDVVVVPHGQDIHFVRVSGPPFYAPEKVDDDTAIRREVIPLLDGSPLARAALPDRLRDFLTFRTTSRDLSPVKDIVLNLIRERSGSVSGSNSAAAQIARDQSRALLLEESMGFTRRSALEAREIERRHADVWHALVAHLQTAGFAVSNQRVGVLGPDLFTVGATRDSLFEIKTGAGSSDYLKGVGQLIIYERALGRPFKKYLVLPRALAGPLQSVLQDLGIDIISYGQSESGAMYFSWPTEPRTEQSNTPRDRM